MNRYRIPLVFALVLAAPNAMAAEDCQIEKQASLPITFNGFVPTVPASINGQAVNIGIDTGSQGSIVTPEAADRLDLPQDPHHTTRAIGTGSTHIVANVVVDDLEFAGEHYTHKSMPVLSMAHKPTADEIRDFGAPNAPMTGLIGADILSKYDIEFDAPGHRLTLYRVSGCTRIRPPWHGRYVGGRVSITRSQRIAMPILLDKHRVTAIFDTGSSGMRLARAAISGLGVTEDMLAQDTTHDGAGVGGGSYKSPSHRFDSVQIGNELFHGLPIDVVDFPPTEADMLIGEDYMHARRFWLSYATSTLFIQSATTH